jgi:hypothetical protein
MTLTEVELYTKSKGKLYKCTTILVNHYSHLRLLHLQINDSSTETVAAKLAFEKRCR